MTDIFDATILCKTCGKPMEHAVVQRNGMELRAVKCSKCGDTIIHPADLNGLHDFNDLKGKTFNVKLRVVGNSHAVSIPKEIINFVENHHKVMRKQMDDMVRLCFQDFDTLSLRFGDELDEDEEEDIRSRKGGSEYEKRRKY